MAKAKFRRSIRSFKDLERLMAQTQSRPASGPCPSPVPGADERRKPGSGAATPVKERAERALFRHAMRDVVPLKQRRAARAAPRSGVAPIRPEREDDEGLQTLTALVREGKNFIIEHTSEYIEGRGYRVPPEITRQLHQGRFAVQDHLDLHGHCRASAEARLSRFFKEALRSGKHGVLIVHGRGRCSADKPVLKAMVQNWLRRGPFRKHLVAYASARPCDGGTGATYVLLRRRPLTRRWRKKRHNPKF